MENVIKYKRIVEILDEENIQQFFDELITKGFIIIHYNENILDDNKIKITLVVAKKQQFL